MIRQCTEADLDFMLDVAAERYPPFDRGTAREWAIRALADPGTLLIRGERGFCVVSLTAYFWEPHRKRANVLFLAARPGGLEGLRLLRYVAELTSLAGVQLHLESITDADLSPLARRLGAKPASPCFVLEATDGQVPE